MVNVDVKIFLCFFFQAEDGIRDPLVTGVQTCALPIFDRPDRDRVLEQHPGRIGLATEAEVDVTVDEPGRQREAVEGELRGVPLAAAPDDRADPPAVDHHRTVTHRRGARAVDQRRPRQDEPGHGGGQTYPILERLSPTGRGLAGSSRGRSGNRSLTSTVDSGTGPVDSGTGRVYLKVDASYDSACDARSPCRDTPCRSRARRGARLRGDRGAAVSAAQARARLRAPRPPGQDGAPRRATRQGRARLLLGDLVTGLPGGVAFRQQALSGPQAGGARGPAGQLQGKCGAREAHGGRARLCRTRAPRRV